MAHQVDLFRVGIMGVLVCSLMGCSGDADQPVDIRSGEVVGSNSAAAFPSGIRQTDDLGNRLPFETVHSRRWNRGNDGTSYEPCTALTVGDLRALGIDPSTVRDSAKTNGQTLRGCDWDYMDSVLRGTWFVAQIVGNAPGLAEEKRMTASDTSVWRDDVLVDGRVVGVLTRPRAGNCTTYVQSGRAAVNTIVFHHNRMADMDEMCNRALEFTRATIGQMPE